jgi:hypothetical protein
MFERGGASFNRSPPARPSIAPPPWLAVRVDVGELARRPQTPRASLAFLYSRLMVCLDRAPPGDTSPRHRIDRMIASVGASHLSG